MILLVSIKRKVFKSSSISFKHTIQHRRRTGRETLLDSFSIFKNINKTINTQIELLNNYNEFQSI